MTREKFEKMADEIFDTQRNELQAMGIFDEIEIENDCISACWDVACFLASDMNCELTADEIFGMMGF